MLPRFQFAGPGFPRPGESQPSPARQELSGVPCPRLGGTGRPARTSLCPACPRNRGHGPVTPRGDREGRGRPRLPTRDPSRSARLSGPRAGPLSPGPHRPALPPMLKKFTSCGWLNAERVESSLHPSPLSRSHLASERNVVPWRFRAVRSEDWGRGAASWGRGRSVLPVALETGLGTGKCRGPVSQVYPSHSFFQRLHP